MLVRYAGRSGQVGAVRKHDLYNIGRRQRFGEKEPEACLFVDSVRCQIGSLYDRRIARESYAIQANRWSYSMPVLGRPSGNLPLLAQIDISAQSHPAAQCIVLPKAGGRPQFRLRLPRPTGRYVPSMWPPDK